MKNKIINTICLLAAFTFTNLVGAQSKFELPALSYSYTALEPYIDAQTMEIHYSKHHQGYVNNLNAAIQGTDLSSLPLEDLLKNVSTYSAAIRNNAGGHYNHTLFWTILTPTANTQPSKRLNDAIVKEFGNLDSLKKLINNAASKQFGSGWAWLCVDENNKLFVSSTPNQDNPLMDIAEKKGRPILGIDVWEHAYYLKYQNKRGDYLASIWNVVNWEEISRRYESIVPKGKFDDWQALKDFHSVMSQTFHPSEKGNLAPIKSRSAEMVEKAKLLSKSTIPAEFDSKTIRATIKKLVTDSEKLHKLVLGGKSDESITKALLNLHDVFHEIIGLCSDDEGH